MPLLDLVALPVRLTRAAVDTTLALGNLVDQQGPVRRPDGYADRLMLVIGRGGLVDRLTVVLSDPHGPMHLVRTATALLDERRPLGRMVEPGGTVDRILAEGGPVDRLLVEGGLLDRMVSEDGFVDKLVAEGGTLDQLVELGRTLERIQPRIAELLELIPELHESVDTLNRSVGPIGDLANRLPGGRRRPAEEG